MEAKYTILLVIWLLLPVDAVKVSFYGTSYITMPLQESKMSTNIRLKFRTMQENALIFLAAGRTDYCLLRLENGRVNLNYKIETNFIQILSPKRLKFSDLMWHDIAIQRYETNITMQVDEHFMRKTLGPNSSELNIHFGTFLGGAGDFSESYLGTIDYFRGCISDVYYNNINLLKRAREKTGHAVSVDVSWTCSSEFDAVAEDTISFVEADSFMMMARSPTLEGESWAFDVRTIEPDGVLFYNSGSDFILLEIQQSKLQAIVRKGLATVQLSPDRNISDGRWHNIVIRYNAAMIEFVFDDFVTSAPFTNSSNIIIDLSKYYCFGSGCLSDATRKKMFNSSVSEMYSNFRGCMRNLAINNNLVGFPHMKVTRGLAVGCVWKYPCLEKSPCILSSSCRQHGTEEFICDCDQSFCIKAEYSQPYKIFAQSEYTDYEIVKVNPIQLLEGEQIFLSPAYIEILFDFNKYGILEQSITFHVVQPPKHGHLKNPTLDNAATKVFSLIDLSTDKVKYAHNGTEHFSDHMTIDLQVTEGTQRIPEYFIGKFRFVLHANITPVNDAPTMNIPSNRILRVTQGVPKTIRSDLLDAFDPDSNTNSLIYTISNTPSNKDMSYGRFQLNGKSTLKFSQKDVNDGSLTYLFNTPDSKDYMFEIPLQVSDGIETSPTIFLPVSVHPLQLRMINNTGLILIHKSSALITPWNLSVISNSDEENVDIQYNIVLPPQYGSIQKLRTIDSSWVPVNSFNSSQVMLGQIRYYHSADIPLQDEFKFTAALGPIVTQKFDFRITFTKMKIGISRQNSVPMEGVRDILITNNFLLHQTVPLPTFTRNIIYTVRKPTKYGNIYVEGHPQFAKEMDSFTQLDIDKNIIYYKTHHTSYSSFIDIMELRVSVSECDDIKGSLKIVYNPEGGLTSRLSYQSKERLHVEEGDRALLTRKNFEILFNTFDNLTFVVTQPAKHGSLCKYESATQQADHIDRFVLEKLYLGDIYYCHDGSESVADSLEMLVLSDEDTDFQFVSEVDVDISLVNDNYPYRQADRVFHIVKDETRTVTEHDLRYLDDDVNTNFSSIIYKHVSCMNGEFYKNGRYTDNFSQDDINNRKVTFLHRGADMGVASFLVSDGVHDVAGSLEIIASDPFVRIAASNASIVQEGKFAVLTNSDLPIETNLDMKLDEVEFTIVKPPTYGVLRILKNKLNSTTQLRTLNMSSIYNFTQMDVERERLVYWNTEPASMDKIRYQVNINNITAEGEILMRIYPAAYWEPLQVLKNQTLYVEESTSVAISKDILKVTHPNISPGDITYLITESPMHGYLEIQSVTSDDEYNCKVFDQSTINSEKMFYIQAGVNQTTDYFVFDVTNGITWLKNLILKIIIIPEVMYIKTMAVDVVEGKTVTIQTDNISPYAEYYKGKILEYKVLKHPSNGLLMVGKSQVNRFTQKQLESGTVQYIHDGSENSSDIATLVAHTRNTESPQFDVLINVLPVNDESPIVLTNTGLQVWNGGKYIIKNTDILAQDHDSPPSNLTFYIHHIYGGYLAYTTTPNLKIDQFTQEDIDNGKVCFLHDFDSKRNEISFLVGDGLFNTTEQFLYIEANPVTLIQLANEHLHVFPMTRKQILPEQLSFKCADETRGVKYNISLPPHLGRILYEYTESGQTQEVSTFSQDDIDNGRILYEHTTAMRELKTNDSFIFDVVADSSNKLHDQRFHIQISVSSGGLLRFLPVSKLTVDEGGSVAIKLDFSKILEYLKSRAGMLFPELYIEAYKPNHGRVGIKDGDQKITRFMPEDFMAQRVLYIHDHSDTLDDEVTMSVYLQQGNIFLCNLSIGVYIHPVNDQPFHLITSSPHITVVEGENKTITTDDLLTTDTDTEPDHIHYEIISGPTLGVLSKKSDGGDYQDILAFANQFTQADINDNRLVYNHYGDVKATTFYFKVSDGVFKPAYEIFNIQIVPVSIMASQHPEPVRIQQGSNTITLNVHTIPVNTNVNRHRIKYNITNSPLSGIIIFNHQPTLHFTQTQLEKGEVNYMQTDMTKSNDNMQINAYVEGTPYGALLDIQISVQPFITINAISIRSGDKIRLTSSLVTDNPTLTKLNRYNPKITITRTPKRGTIRKIIRNSGEIESLNNRNINTFTYKEMKSGIIYFVADNLQDEISINDYFEYTLVIKSVQPGESTVPIEIHTIKENIVNSYDTAITAADVETLPLPYIVLILVIIALISLICVALIVIKLRFKRLNKGELEKDVPPPLPRPPDFVSLNNNGRMYSGSEDESVPVTAASTPLPGLSNIPHCKVIQVGIEPDMQDYDIDDETLDDLGERQRMTQDRYNPYGENDEWSSSCDMANELGYSTVSQCNQSTNPLLRRNQYWV